MKKLISIFTLLAFALYASDPVPVENSDADSQSEISSPTHTTLSSPVREREEKPSQKWKAIAAVVGTLAAITAGLFTSGRDAGKPYHKSLEEKKAS